LSWSTSGHAGKYGSSASENAPASLEKRGRIFSRIVGVPLNEVFRMIDDPWVIRRHVVGNKVEDKRGALFPLYLVTLAESFAGHGRRAEGLSAVAEGLRRAEQTGETMAEAELYRVEGELLQMWDPSDEAKAEHCFRTAIEIARRQQARFWELRATTSLARLLKRQGKTDDALKMLAEIYNWFTEGFDTADLKDAKALLDELSA